MRKQSIIATVLQIAFLQTITYAQLLSTDDVLIGLPISEEAKAAFKNRVEAKRLTRTEADALIWQLLAEGETLLPDKDKEEMTGFYWKAVGTLTPEEQMLITRVNLRVRQGGGSDAAGQDAAQALVQKGFSQLKTADNDRFIQLRCRCIELALLRSQEAKTMFATLYPPQSAPHIQQMALEQKAKRYLELTLKGLNALSDKDIAKLVKLHLIPQHKLTKDQYSERIRYSKQIVNYLSGTEQQEYMDLITELFEGKISEKKTTE